MLLGFGLRFRFSVNEGKQGLLFLKEKNRAAGQKTLVKLAPPVKRPRPSLTKVFWFFFSKKNFFISSFPRETHMCLAVPMRVVTVDRFIASCEARGIFRDVSLFLLPEGSVAAGDHVLVHVGYAIQVVSQPDAAASWQLFDIITADQDRLSA